MNIENVIPNSEIGIFCNICQPLKLSDYKHVSIMKKHVGVKGSLGSSGHTHSHSF